ncbi:MAG TPA: LuxR C-terminal-related transcriptional regulator [Actinomycetes bacterium]|nr:LuxR C-terminal-related transcriptional regulator [Actinomycetes bacterium]
MPPAKVATPRLPALFVPRPRLHGLLTEAVASRVTLVSAGPGSGKTLGVASWAADGRAPGPVAWLALDESDNDPATLWREIVAALHVAGAPASRAGVLHVSPFGAPEIRRLTAGFTSSAAPVVLVVDDVEALTRDEARACLDQLIAEASAQLRIVLITRTDPDLPLHRLRVVGDLSEIRGDELAFDGEEAGRLFADRGLSLDAGQRESLLARTEGWATGLRLALLALSDGDVDRAISDFSGDQRSVADYLIGEVLRRRPPQVQRLLLRTSITERICGPLADLLADRTHSQRELERLAQAHPLVHSLDAHHTWFRYHRLLRELLQHELQIQEPSLVPELHRRAAAWWEAAGQPVEALRHASAAGDWRHVRRLLVDVALPMLLSPDRSTLAGAVRPAAAQAAVRPSLDTLIPAAAWHLFERNIPVMDKDADEAERRLGELDDAEVPMARVAIGLFRLMALRTSGDANEVVRVAGEMLSLLRLGPGSRPPAARHYEVVAAAHLAAGLLWLGEHAQARRHLVTAAAEADALGLGLTRLFAHSHLAVLDAMEGRLHAAEQTASAVLDSAARGGWGDESQVQAARLAIAMVHLARDRPDLAGRQLGEGLDGTGSADGAVRLAMRIALVHVALAHRDPSSARLACSRIRDEITVSAAPDWVLGWLATTEAETALLTNNAELALTLLKSVPHSPEAQVLRVRAHLLLGDRVGASDALALLLARLPVSLAVHVQVWLLEGVLANARHDDVSAIEALRRALALAEPEELRRPFRALGPDLAATVARYLDVVEGLGAFALRHGDGGQAEGGPEDRLLLAERLSSRELAVLSYLPSMLTNEEIGMALFVSVNTVKAHLKSLYRKLGVTGRREAVRRARELDLL